MVICLVQVLQEVTAHHLCWQDGANLVASLIHLAVIDYFLKQNIEVGNQNVTCTLAAIYSFQSHPDRHSIGAPVEVWCKDLFELEGEATFIPVQLI